MAWGGARNSQNAPTLGPSEVVMRAWKGFTVICIFAFFTVLTLLLKILILISNKTLLDLYLLLSLGKTDWKLFPNMERLGLITSLVFRRLQLGQGLSVSSKDPGLQC